MIEASRLTPGRPDSDCREWLSLHDADRLAEIEGTRFAGRIGFHRNEPWQAFEIDSPASLAMCELLMEHYALGR